MIKKIKGFFLIIISSIVEYQILPKEEKAKYEKEFLNLIKGKNEHNK